MILLRGVLASSLRENSTQTSSSDQMKIIHPLSFFNSSAFQTADYTTCPVQLEQTPLARWRRWRRIASPPPRSTPASRCSLRLTSPCATRTTALCPTVHPRITSSSTSAWAGRRRVQGKGRSPPASFVSFLLSVNAGQHTDLQRFLTLKAI